MELTGATYLKLTLLFLPTPNIAYDKGVPTQAA